MDNSLPKSSRYGSRKFRKIVDAFLGGADLPFAEVLSEERIERIFQKHGCSLGLHGVYTTAITVWSFLSQVLRDGKEASCLLPAQQPSYRWRRRVSRI
jgi:putative transposase